MLIPGKWILIGMIWFHGHSMTDQPADQVFGSAYDSQQLCQTEQIKTITNFKLATPKDQEGTVCLPEDDWAAGKWKTSKNVIPLTTYDK